MKNESNMLPLNLIRAVSSRYEDVWNIVDDLHGKNGDPAYNAVWHPNCYLPIGVCQEILHDVYDIKGDNKTLASHAAQIAALAGWRQYKVVYALSSRLALALQKQAEDTDNLAIPMQIFYQLPAYCMYITCKDVPLLPADTSITGVLVHIEDDVNTKEKELRLLLLSNSYPPRPYMLNLIDGGTIKDCMRRTVDIVVSNIYRSHSSYSLDLINANALKMSHIIKTVVQYILYICASNADIQENPEQQALYHPGATIKDKYREIRKFDVGASLQLLRPEDDIVEKEIYQKRLDKEDDTLRAHPRAHVRRAHWHHFWTGARKGHFDQRKLILKWIPPIIVNSEQKDNK